jgi:DNA repair protein RadC
MLHSPSYRMREQLDIPELAATMQASIGESPIEHMVVIFLDRDGDTLSFQHVAEGTEHQVSAEWTEIFNRGWKLGARYCVVGHNHPNGAMGHSKADAKYTTWVRTIGSTLGIDVLDHIIVGPARGVYYSFYERGLI